MNATEGYLFMCAEQNMEIDLCIPLYSNYFTSYVVGLSCVAAEYVRDERTEYTGECQVWLANILNPWNIIPHGQYGKVPPVTMATTYFCLH